MKKKMKMKRVYIAGIVLVGLLLILCAGFYIYTLDYYRADESVKSWLSSDPSNLQRHGNLTVVSPDPSLTSGDGIIFYPGGKVEATAYLPLLEQLSKQGLTCILVKMPFNLAVFEINAAETVYDQFPEIQQWYLAGHSLGGAMASSYAGKHFERLNGLILLGAYPINDADVPTIAIYGSEDIRLDRAKLDGLANKIEISGGNHAYFGNYGEQSGDGVATISREEQQKQAVEDIVGFIRESSQGK